MILLSILYMVVSNRARRVTDFSFGGVSMSTKFGQGGLNLQTLGHGKKGPAGSSGLLDKFFDAGEEQKASESAAVVDTFINQIPVVSDDDLELDSSDSEDDMSDVSSVSSDGSVNRDDIESPVASPARAKPAKFVDRSLLLSALGGGGVGKKKDRSLNLNSLGGDHYPTPTDNTILSERASPAASPVKPMDSIRQNKANRKLNLGTLGALSTSRTSDGIAAVGAKSPAKSPAQQTAPVSMRANKASRAVDLQTLVYKGVVPTTTTPRQRRLHHTPSRFSDFFALEETHSAAAATAGARGGGSPRDLESGSEDSDDSFA
jgi:hypothetical protein